MDESESYLHQTQVLLRLLLAIDSCFISISVFLGANQKKKRRTQNGSGHFRASQLSRGEAGRVQEYLSQTSLMALELPTNLDHMTG